mmetsp:Transcript_2236/g.4538  ORF Transcript_2236/g.4538 Transcript_2236/m.4538 type:complete len:552 (+) Transcript_2236:3-1658(+)
MQQLQLSRHHDRGDHFGFFPTGFDGNDNNRRHHAPTQKISLHPNPIIYNDILSIPNFHSSGPRIINPKIPSLYEFRNVCLTNHITSPTLRGLVYLTPPIFDKNVDNKDRNKTATIISEPMEQLSIQNNPHRCVPCSAPLNHKGGWNGIHPNEKQVGHRCGFVSVHAMFATNISDWSHCIHDIPENSKLIQKWGQVQIPSCRVESVHFYEGTVLNVAFDRNIGHAMWDHLLTYLPHWYEFRFGKGGSNHKSSGDFPFDYVVLNSVKNCLSKNNSSEHWYCQILRSIDAFGVAEELPVDGTNANSTTLVCYENLLTLHLSLPRLNHYSMESLPNKNVFDAFRDVLFKKFKLPRYWKKGRRDNLVASLGGTLSNHNNNDQASIQNRKDSTTNQQTKRHYRFLFYAHEPSGRRVWTNMNSLLAAAQVQTKYRQIDFQTVYDFGNLNIQQQARLFNEADAIIMVHGAQMANSIFTVEGTMFVELGCRVFEFLGSKNYLNLIGGKYTMVQLCWRGETSEKDFCLDCTQEKDFTYSNFTMAQKTFDKILDDIVIAIDS